MRKRFTSRKFIVALAAQIAGLVVLLWPEHEQDVRAVAESVAALAVVVLSAVGYIAAEASVDRRATDRSPDRTSASEVDDE